MELEDLKSIWKKQPPVETKQDEEIALMLQGQSKSIISKLKRSVWFELIFTIVCGIALGIYGLTIESGALMWTIVSLLVLLVSYLFYYVKKLMLLNQFDPAGNLKENVTQILDRLTTYLTFYKRSYAILYPVYFLLGLLFGAIERGLDDFINHVTQPVTLLILIGLGVTFFILSSWITNWYLKKLYGNNIEKLKNLLNDLEA
jgi:sulfite exporter TauE/SafE